MTTIGRDPSAAGRVVHRHAQTAFGPGLTLECAADEAAVVTRHGAVLGVLRPGRHALDPSALPFLHAGMGPHGLELEIFFVRTAPVDGLRIGGGLGALADASGQAIQPSWAATAGFRVTDPARFVVEMAGAAPIEDVGRGVEELVRSHLLRAATSAAAMLLSRRGSAVALLDPTGTAELDAAAREAANAGLSQLPIEVTSVATVSLTAPGVGAAAAAPPGGDRTYEMLWDCRYCGTKKNLGLTHRHCPGCGAAQDADDRYFPSDADKVAVEDHRFVGADVQCPYCSKYSSRAARNCGGCGAPLEGAQDAARRGDQVGAGPYAGESLADAEREAAARRAAAMGAAPEPAKPKSRTGLFVGGGCGCLLLVACVAVAAGFLMKSESELVVAGHTWSREVQVERYGPVQDDAWCDQLPRGARDVRRSREVRSHDKVPDGQDCRTRRIDNGDGTYRETQECTPRFRNEPVYDDKCRFTIDRWSVGRTERAAGNSLAEAPRWPDVQIARPGECVGCEREGGRSESYVVRFTEPDGGEAICDLPQERWAGFPVGSRWKGDVSVLGGVLDCDSLRQ